MSAPPNAERDGIRDRRIDEIEALARPTDLLGELPLPPEGAELVIRSREEVTAILERTDDRLMVVVGPCSVHDTRPRATTPTRLAAKAQSWTRTSWSSCASTSKSRARPPVGRA